MRKFVALFDEPNSEDALKFVEFLKEKNYGYWHWTSGSWLIVARESDESISQTLRDKIKAICQSHVVLVLEIDNVLNWSGFGPSSSHNDMFSWIRDELSDQKTSRPDQLNLDLKRNFQSY